MPTTFFARVKEDCELNGYRPAGTKAIACLRETMHDPATFSAPDTFDPDRFSPERAEDKQPNRFIPDGGGRWRKQIPHYAGEKLAELMIQVYATLLLRDYTWELPSADHSLTTRLIPMPKDSAFPSASPHTRGNTPPSPPEGYARPPWSRFECRAADRQAV